MAAPALMATIVWLFQTRTSSIEPLREPRALALQFSTSSKAYIPINGTLKTQEVASSVSEAQQQAFGDRTPLLNEVIRLAPGYFPPQARVVSVNSGSRSGNFLINLNRAFANPKFWRTRNRRDSGLAFHALARNVAFMNEPKGAPLPVQFLIEGKRVNSIGAFNTSQPLPPDKLIRSK